MARAAAAATAPTEDSEKPKRVIGPRPLYIMYECDSDGITVLDGGLPVIGKVPEGAVRRKSDPEVGELAITRSADSALDWQQRGNLKYQRIMVK